jgi:CubicO group peptidase (beta-lactamase class C family)
LDGKPPANNLPVSISYKPGSDYYYSGAGYMVLQQVLEEITAEPFQQYMNRNVLASLEMTHSVFQYPLSEKQKLNAIPGFKSTGEMNENEWENIASSASGGLWSTSEDLARFTLAIAKAYRGIENSTLAKTLAVEMLTRQLNSNFGLGFVVDGKGEAMNFRKNGHNTGYHAQLIMFPNSGKGMVVMTNSAKGLALIQELIAKVAHYYQWPNYSPHFDELLPSKNIICRL